MLNVWLLTVLSCYLFSHLFEQPYDIKVDSLSHWNKKWLL